MSREHELITRLRECRKALAQARNELEDAKLQLAGRKEVYRRVQADIDEALEEIETGRSSRPVLDVIERNGQAPAPAPYPSLAESQRRMAADASVDLDVVESADERQRGPTLEGRKTEDGRRKKLNSPPTSDLGLPPSKKERADRREVVISPNGPIRQEKYIGPTADELCGMIHAWQDTPLTAVFSEALTAKCLHFGLKTLGALANALGLTPVTAATFLEPDERVEACHALWDWRSARKWDDDEGFPKALCGILQPGKDPLPDSRKKTFAVYVRDPVDHSKAGRGLGYIDATSKDKALALATKKWPAIKPSEILISPPGWEQSPPPADGPERPKPIQPDPSAEWVDEIARDNLEQGSPGEPDSDDRPEGAKQSSTGHRPVRNAGKPDPTLSPWAASVPVPGVKGAQEFLGSFLATDEEDALAVARARWPGRPDIAVRRAGPPAAAAAADKPPARKRKPKAQPAGV